nr:probable LRR receptor-like serine/threonine-protein kinase At1g34110 [Tanacetum cinerariifolium]
MDIYAFHKACFTIDNILECLKAEVIGKRCSGVVYKAEMPNGEIIAVKKLWKTKKDEELAIDSFATEIQILSHIRHRNIIKLLGYCSNRSVNLLLYNHIAKGNLQQLLQSNRNLDWETRYKIAVGSAQGLVYLHHDCVPAILHRDVKCNNILFDCKYEAYLADFGLAKLTSSTNYQHAMSRVAGSYGYIAPNYGYTMNITEKSDVLRGKMLGELNDTLVTLIPKIQTPNKVTDFIPIAYCNVLYKCTSKVLTNRIKASLRNLVSRNQSAFIPVRHIQDNILLTQEIMRGYNMKVGPKRVAFKIDIQKAYDTVNWDFLKKALKGGRGLRQGDPISPYLFTLIMKVFSLILQREIKKEPMFQYHFGCKSLNLSHVCFADDLLVMCHGDTISVRVVKKALNKFSASSGLLPNNYKSTVFFGSMNEDESNAISIIFPFKKGKLRVKYLGVPLIAKRLGINECGDLYDERLSSGLSVRDMVENSEWKWHANWHHKFPTITSLAVPNINDDTDDKMVWKTSSRMFTDFSVSIDNHDLNKKSHIV